MSCGPSFWTGTVIESFGAQCIEQSDTYLLPYTTDNNGVYKAGSIFVVDDQATPTGTKIPAVKLLAAPPDLSASHCTQLLILKCDVNVMEDNPDQIPCPEQLGERGLVSIGHIPWPSTWGVDEIRKVKIAGKCCGIRLFWPNCC